MTKTVICGCPATQDAIRNNVSAEPGRCIGCGTPVEQWILTDARGWVFRKEDGSWTRNRSEAERFNSRSEAFSASCEGNGRYPEKL